MSNIIFKTIKAIDFCDDVRDGTHDSPKHLDTGRVLITSKNIKSESIDFETASFISEEDYNKINERSLVEKNDILYSMIGTVGLVHRVATEPNYAIKNMGLFKISDENKSKWLYYYLKSPEAIGEVESKLSGSTQKFISLSNLRNLNIKYPEDNVIAIKIVKILESIEKKIKLNNQTNNNLYDICKTIYNERFSNKTDSLVKLDSISIITSGKRPLKKDTGIIPLIGASGEMGYTNNYNIDEKVLITGRVGTLGIVKRYNYKIWASDNTLIINSKYINYIEQYLNTIDFNKLNRGSTQPLLTQTDLKNLELYFNEEEVLKYCDEIEIFKKSIEENGIQNKTLEQLRNTLLPKLMNGEIDLDNIEI